MATEPMAFARGKQQTVPINQVQKRFYLYDQGNAVVELDTAGSVVATNVYAPDGLVARKTSSTTWQYLFDWQGNVSHAMTSGTGVGFSAAYTAWGQRNYVWPIQPPGSWDDNFAYNGRWGYVKDSSTGYYSCQNRYYDPANGRWLTRDPIGYAGGVNLYGYCGSGPVGTADPFGLKLWSFQKWLVTGDGYAEDGTYEAGLAQGYHSLQRWAHHFSRRNGEAAELVLGGTLAPTIPYAPVPKPLALRLEGAERCSSLLRWVSNKVGRRLGRGGRGGPLGKLHSILDASATQLKRRVRALGRFRAVTGPALAGFALVEAGLAWGAASDTLNEPLWGAVELLNE